MEQFAKTPVSIEAIYDNPDICAYVESKDAYPHGGYDTWVMIGGVDKLTDGSGYIIEFGDTGEIRVPNDFVAYVDRGVYCITNEEKADQRWKSQ